MVFYLDVVYIFLIFYLCGYYVVMYFEFVRYEWMNGYLDFNFLDELNVCIVRINENIDCYR